MCVEPKMFLGSTSPSAPLTEVESEAIIRCRVTKECARDFRLLLERKGVWQGGPCFGVRTNGELRLQAARPGGPVHCFRQATTRLLCTLVMYWG